MLKCLCMLSFADEQEFCRQMLRPSQALQNPTKDARTSSVFICKYYMSAEADQFRRDILEPSFEYVRAEKMAASRAESREQYWVCIGYRGNGTA